MLKVRFNDLLPVTRARFLAMSLAAPNDPRLLYFSQRTNPFAGIGNWLLAGLASLMVVVTWTALLDKGARVEPSYDVSRYVFLAVAVALDAAAIAGIVYRVVWKRAPYRNGVYALRTAIVRATDGVLDVLPLEQVGKPQITHHYRNGRYGGTETTFAYGCSIWFNTQKEAVERTEAILVAREHCMRALQTRDVATLGAIDVFYECTTTGQWSHPGQPPVAPLVPVVPSIAVTARWLGALVFGAVVAAILYAVVDLAFASDRAAYKLKWATPPTPSTSASSSTPQAPSTLPTPSATPVASPRGAPSPHPTPSPRPHAPAMH